MEPFEVKAIFDYVKNDHNELDLKKDETYKVIDINEQWWLVIASDNSQGWIPSNYVQKLNNIDQNTDKIDQNTDKIDQKSDKIDQKSDKIDQNTDKIDQNTDKIDQKTDKIDQKTDKNDQKSDEIDQKSDKIDQKTDKIDQKSDKNEDKEDILDKDLANSINSQQFREECERFCDLCKKPITSSYVSGDNIMYHSDCFNCSNCKTNLAGSPYIAKDNLIFCKNCYSEKFAPKCAFCNETLKSEYIKALDQNWHKDHFVCCDCGKPFEETYHKHDNLPYCSECFTKNFVSICDVCHKPIIGNFFSVGFQKIHVDCFKCAVDGKVLGIKDQFQTKEDKIYCREHFIEKFGDKCYRCQKIIDKEYFKIGDKKFHQKCFVCDKCGVSLQNDKFALVGEQFLCSKDSMQNKSSKNEEKTDKNEEQSEKMNEEKSEKMNENLKIEKCSKKEIKSIEEIEKEIEKADRIYSYEKLSKTADEVPPFIDYSKRESYLSDEEFEQIFKMQKAEFYKLTLWKQKILKKNVRLF